MTIEVSLNNTATSSTDRGTMIAYEATYATTSGTTAATGGMQASMDTCSSPSKWDPSAAVTGPHPIVVDGINLNSQADDNALVHVAINGVLSGDFAYCFTPSGKMYTWTGTDFASTAFVTSPNTLPVKFSVFRETNTLTRDVLVMPSGAVRISSRTT